MTTIASVDALFAVLAEGGKETYFGEPVTVLEHSLQSAWFAGRKGGSPALVTAALLHDLEHLLHSEGEDAAQRGLDTRHEELAFEALNAHLPGAVLTPIRMHVVAKRYLCTTNPQYLAQLSSASMESLALQGGLMSAVETEAFAANPHAQDAIALRHADDAAKVKGLKVPELEAYRELVEGLWR